jgi:PAS domain S-box-containing protein
VPDPVDDRRPRTAANALALAVEAGGVGVFDWDLSSGAMSWNPALQEMFGYTAADFRPTADSFFGRLHPEDRDRVTRAVDTAVRTRGRFAAEYRVVLPDGRTRWVQGRGQVRTDGTGAPARFVGTAYDTTEVHTGDVRTGRLLATMPWGFVVLDPDWRFTVVNPAAEALLRRPADQLVGRVVWEVFPAALGGELETALRTAVATQQSQTLTAHHPAPVDVWFDVSCWPSPEGLTLFFADATERTLADRQAAAIAGRLALLAEVSDALVTAPDVADVLDALPRLLVPVTADACIVTVLGPDGRARDVSSWHADPDRRADLAGYATTRLVDLPGTTPFAQVVHTGLLRHVTPEQTAAVPMHPVARAHLDALGPVRGSIVPLRSRGRVLGALTLLSAADRPRDPDTERVVVDIADRVATAVEADRLRRARTQLTEDLQRSLLTAPPEPDHAEVVVRYQPAAEAARVGGDWYDAFLQRDGTTMVVIGDVVGHDTAAAAAMGQLRGLLRGIATYSDGGPAEVLRGLDAAVEVLQVGALATAAVARFEQTPDEVERGVTRMVWSNAGHPPPLVLHTDGRVDVLERRPQLLLGVDPGTPRTEHVVVLDRGATILLYTDGLVERRDADLDEGTARLTAVTARLGHLPLQQLCDGLVRELVDGHPDDDIALVAVRLHRQDRPRPAEAGPQVVPPGVPAPAHPAQ